MATKKQSEELIDLNHTKEIAQDFFEKNRNLVLGVLTALVVGVGGYFGYKYLVQEPQQVAALEQMYQAEFAFEKDSFEMALKNPGGGYSGFLDIIDNYGSTPAGNLAKYYAGICYLNLNNYADAVKHLEDFDATGNLMPILKYGALGDAESELNNTDKAKSYFKKAISAGDDELLTPLNMRKLATLHEQANENDAALVLYKEIKEKYPKSPDAHNIDKYIIRLTK